MVKKIKLQIQGMHCTSCAMNIDGDLEDLEGVKSSNTSYAKGEVEVEFDTDKICTQDLVKQIQNTGYNAEGQ